MTGMGTVTKPQLTGNYLHDKAELERHLQSLHAAVTALEEKAEALAASATADLRLRALQAARQHVSSMDSERANERGYRDHALKPGERISEELRIARFLLSGLDGG